VTSCMDLCQIAIRVITSQNAAVRFPRQSTATEALRAANFIKMFSEIHAEFEELFKTRLNYVAQTSKKVH